MSSLKVRNVEIGKGIPKIIAPICDKTEEEILHTARKFSFILHIIFHSIIMIIKK